jgi:hypothetical protein
VTKQTHLLESPDRSDHSTTKGGRSDKTIGEVVVSTNSSYEVARWILECAGLWIRQKSTMNFRHVRGRKKILSMMVKSGVSCEVVKL